MGEFELIEHFFGGTGWYQSDFVTVGPGDDCAVLDLPASRLCGSTDTMNEGVHFPVDTPGEVVAHRIFAATVSDVAAMGARPVGLTLALTMPTADEAFLQGYSDALKSLTHQYETPLVGGNVASGPLSVTGHIMGVASAVGPLLRSGARIGDDIYVTRSPGAAAHGLELALARLDVNDPAQGPYLFPAPRVGAGLAVASLATAAIDITDGLLADLGHIAKASDVGARVEASLLPEVSGVTLEQSLSGGDDYELCITVPRDSMLDASVWTKIGTITEAQAGVRCEDTQGQLVEVASSGYRHF